MRQVDWLQGGPIDHAGANQSGRPAQCAGLSRITVVGSYEMLLSDVLVEARVGAGTFVANHVPTGPARSERAPATDMAPVREVFALGRTSVDALFLNRLRRAVG